MLAITAAMLVSGFVATLRNGGKNSINSLRDLVSGAALEVPKDRQGCVQSHAVKTAINAMFGATVVQSTLDNAANAPLELKLSQLLYTASTFGTFTQDAYDARQIEFVLKTSF